MLLRFKAKQELKESLQSMKYILYITYLQYRHDKKLFSKYCTLLSKATLATVVSLKKGKTYCTLSCVQIMIGKRVNSCIMHLYKVVLSHAYELIHYMYKNKDGKCRQLEAES